MPIVKEYYGDGALKAKGLEIAGLKEGKWTFYYENGRVFREIHFQNGIENGEWKMWYENDELYISQLKKSGKTDGEWKEYYENGNIKEIGEYQNNEYFPIDFWDEFGNQLLRNGTGKKIEKFGPLESYVYEQYFENGKFVKEVKISGLDYRGFFPK
jgi:antitoxin component YwqK of YwqJK toxin-antitoxin module